MKISNINYKFINPFLLIKPNYTESRVSSPISAVKFNGNLKSDIVSFSAKSYNIEDIVHPTNHCAYCGCKVYSDEQLDALTKELMTLKADRLHGKIKSVLEKLSEARNSSQLQQAKKIENTDEIKFFKKFLDVSENKSYLRGEQVIAELYSLEDEKIFEKIRSNLRPLMRTIDHITPQNEDKDNMDSDINLVESCYTCNHDIKDGLGFAEFFGLFPDIQENMPKDKFLYAKGKLLDFSSDGIEQRLSATALLKHVKRLCVQRQEAASYLDSLSLKIKNCESSIDNSIQVCQEQIKLKNEEANALTLKFEELKKDPEFCAILQRNSLLENIDTVKKEISELKQKRQNANNQIEDLRDKSKNKKKNGLDKLTPEQKQEKIKELKENVELYTENIVKKEERKLELSLELEDLNSRFPSIEMLQQSKHEVDSVIFAYDRLANKQEELETKTVLYDSLKEDVSKINAEIKLIQIKNFNLYDYSEEQQALFTEYQNTKEAIDYIETHPNGGTINLCIRNAAKKPLEDRLKQIEQSQIVQDFLAFNKMQELIKQLETKSKKKEDVKNEISSINNQIAANEKICKLMSLDEAKAKSTQYAEDINRIFEKQKNLNIPQLIEKLKAEIILLDVTILDLTKTKAQVLSV